jgi:hypothetical protein
MADSGGSSKNVRVLVRCRPLLPREASGTIATLRVDQTGRSVGMGVPGSASETRFTFDGVADMTCTQVDVFELGRIGELVAATLSGYHSTIFAYGQTASGKTFTMEGYEYGRDRSNKPLANLQTEPRKLGIIPRTVGALFERVAAAGGEGALRVRMSYFQLYKEQIYDLLSTSAPADARAAASAGADGRRPRRGLKLRWSAGVEFYVQNLSEYEVSSAEEALELFRTGVSHKAMAETHLNAASSRSHCVLQLRVERIELASGAVEQAATLSLVDLAGSERQAKGTERSAAMLDSVEINRSLFALRKVIVALADGPRKTPHVPYRDSVLTKVLKHSLGGSARTLMVACISPADEAADESLSTLAYAARARTIVNAPLLNVPAKSREVARLKEELALLRAEVQRLSSLLSVGGLGLGSLDGHAPRAAGGWGEAPGAMGGGGGGGSSVGGCGGGGGGGDSSSATVDGGRGRGGSASPASPAASRVDLATHRHLGDKLVEAVGALSASLATTERLRAALDGASAARERSERQAAELMGENTRQSERLKMLEAVVAMEAYPDASWHDTDGDGRAADGADGGRAGSAAQARAAALLKEAVREGLLLRAENAQLRDWLDAPPGAQLRGAAPAARASAAPAERAQRPPVGAAAQHASARVQRLTSAGGSFGRHDDAALLLGSEQLVQAALLGGPSAPPLPPPPAADTFESLEQLAVLLRQRAELSRHAKLVATLGARAAEPAPPLQHAESTSGASYYVEGQLPARRAVSSAGPAAGAARAVAKQRAAARMSAKPRAREWQS